MKFSIEVTQIIEVYHVSNWLLINAVCVEGDQSNATSGDKTPWQVFHPIACEIIHNIVQSSYQVCHGDFNLGGLKA